MNQTTLLLTVCLAAFAIGNAPLAAENTTMLKERSISATNHAPVDFISTHTYGVESGYLDEYGKAGTVLAPNPNSIFGDVKRVRQQITDSAMPKLQMHFTEWSASYTVEVFKVGYRVNDAYTGYLDLGSPNQLTPAQVAQLKAASSGNPISSKSAQVGNDGSFKQEFVLRDNDAVLLTLKPATP